MADYAPKYWLINGKAYPNTDPIPTDIGHRVLLRYVNAGLLPHSMSLGGLRQTIVATDAKPEAHPSQVVADTVPEGGSLDTIATIPAGAFPGTQYAVFDAAMHLDNAGALTTPGSATSTLAFGGMLTFMSVAGTFPGPSAPVTSNAAFSLPNPILGNAPDTLSATGTSPVSTISQMEYFVDTIGTEGTGTAMQGTFGTATVNATHTLSTADLALLSTGNHTFWVHAKDATGVWGAYTQATLSLDKAGPVITSSALTPGDTNGSADVLFEATASDTTGLENVTAGEYFIGATGAPGTGTPMTITLPAPDASMTATIPAATVAGLSEGAHTISVRGQDALGVWGALATITLTVDKSGPATSGVVTTPTPTNGTIGVPICCGSIYYQVINATITDPTVGGVNSNIAGAEYFFDTTGAPGTGGQMNPASNGAFNTSTSMGVYSGVVLPAIRALGQGLHTVYVRGKDAAGNWGPFSTTSLIVDLTPPTLSGVTLTPNPTNGATSLHLTATATDPANPGSPANAPASNVVAAEWFIGTDPGIGNGTPITVGSPATTVNLSATINIASLGNGTFNFSLRAEDAAANWSAITTVTLVNNTLPNALFSDGFDSGNFSHWSSCTNCTGGASGRISVTTAAHQAGADSMAATVSGGTSGYVQDNSPTNENSYHARFYFNPNNATAGAGAVTIFSGLTSTNGSVFSVQLRKNGSYQVRATVSRSGGSSVTNWYNISANTFTAIEIAWASGPSSSFSLYTGGTLQQTLTLLNTSTFKLETVRLGPQGTLTGLAGTMYFDSFVSTRYTVIGL
jgi:hypothetical protein